MTNPSGWSRSRCCSKWIPYIDGTSGFRQLGRSQWDENRGKCNRDDHLCLSIQTAEKRERKGWIRWINRWNEPKIRRRTSIAFLQLIYVNCLEGERQGSLWLGGLLPLCKQSTSLCRICTERLYGWVILMNPYRSLYRRDDHQLMSGRIIQLIVLSLFHWKNVTDPRDNLLLLIPSKIRLQNRG